MSARQAWARLGGKNIRTAPRTRRRSSRAVPGVVPAATRSPSAMRSRRPASASRMPVMRKPLRTKNRSTPRYPRPAGCCRCGSQQDRADSDPAQAVQCRYPALSAGGAGRSASLVPAIDVTTRLFRGGCKSHGEPTAGGNPGELMRRPCRSGYTDLSPGSGDCPDPMSWPASEFRARCLGSATTERALFGQLPRSPGLTLEAKPGQGHAPTPNGRHKRPRRETQCPSTASAQEAEAGVTGLDAGPSADDRLNRPSRAVRVEVPDPQRPIGQGWEWSPPYVQFRQHRGAQVANGHADEP